MSDCEVLAQAAQAIPYSRRTFEMTMYETWCAEGNRVGPVLHVPPPIAGQERGSRVAHRSPELVPPASRTPDDAKIDAEFDRFFAIAVPTPDGLGLYDPSESPEMPSGVLGEDWRRFEDDFRHLDKRSKT